MIKKIAYLVPLFFPFVAFAQVLTTVEGTVTGVTGILNAFIPLFITLGLVYFFYGVAKYVTAKEATAKEEARSVMIYGLIGLFVLVSVWGIINVIGTLTGISTTSPPPTISVPTVQ